MAELLLLDVRGVSKTFPGVRALKDVSLSVARGEIVALVGQNGSGKSTLVKILAGFYEADPGGEIRVGGEDGDLVETNEQRLNFIHQDLGLVSSLSTIENLDVGRRLGGRAFLPSRTGEELRHANRVLREFGQAFDVRAPVARLTPTERTIVAIARAFDGWTRPDNVLVLDEPTSTLHGDEVSKLFDTVRRVASRGAGIIFISHRLDEVMELADRIVVLRDGQVVANVKRDRFDHDRLVRAMAGRDVINFRRSAGVHAGNVVLEARGLSSERLRGVDLHVRGGEVVGVTGILGSGREQVAGMLFGAIPRAAGDVQVNGEMVEPDSPRAAIDRGIGLVPADRVTLGAIMSLNVRENLTLPALRPLTTAAGVLSGSAERREAERWIARVDVRPANPEGPLPQLSGGNQQKVVLAKWLRNESRALLLDEPTQGVDVAAKAAVHELIVAAAAGGAAVLICSSDTKELVALCDRVLVLRDGAVAAEIDAAALTEARLVRETWGVHDDDNSALGQ